MTDFVHLLIAEVKSRSVLWNVNDRHYHDRQRMDKEWRKIAANIGESKEVVKAKWKNLRDTFRRELKKISLTTFDDESETRYLGTWPHFDTMKFLSPYCIPKPADGTNSDSFIDGMRVENQYSEQPEFIEIEGDSLQTIQIESPVTCSQTMLTVEAGPSEEAQHSEEPRTSSNSMCSMFQMEIKEENEILPLPETNGPVITHSKKLPTSRKRKFQATMQTDKEISDNESSNVTFRERDISDISEDDEDMYFFKSLLPHVRQLRSINKLYFRSQVLTLLAKELSKTD